MKLPKGFKLGKGENWRKRKLMSSNCSIK